MQIYHIKHIMDILHYVHPHSTVQTNQLNQLNSPQDIAAEISSAASNHQGKGQSTEHPPPPPGETKVGDPDPVITGVNWGRR